MMFLFFSFFFFFLFFEGRTAAVAIYMEDGIAESPRRRSSLYCPSIVALFSLSFVRSFVRSLCVCSGTTTCYYILCV